MKTEEHEGEIHSQKTEGVWLGRERMKATRDKLNVPCSCLDLTK